MNTKSIVQQPGKYTGLLLADMIQLASLSYLISNYLVSTTVVSPRLANALSLPRVPH